MRRVIPLALVLAIGASACSRNNSSTSTTTPSATLTTDTFSGTVAVRGSDAHTFSVAQTGPVSITLSAAGPPSTIVMGIGIGTPNGSDCSLFAGASTNTPAGSAAQLTGTVSAASLCVTVYDIGNATASVTYTVAVSHP